MGPQLLDTLERVTHTDTHTHTHTHTLVHVRDAVEKADKQMRVDTGVLSTKKNDQQEK